MINPINILERYWNYTSFREGQEEIINAVLDNEDCFALLPTGGGKSICYQVPALIKEGICIVVSPLIALMNDQVAALKNRNIKAMALTSEYGKKDIDIMLDNCIYGNYKFLYLSPERLQSELVQTRIKQMAVNLIAVDEAHCISEWGHDFRPAYKQIKILRELHPAVNVLALTATAQPKVVDDIISKLELMQPKVFQHSFRRENLTYLVKEKEDKYYALESILKEEMGSAIVYVRTRKLSIQLSEFLNSKGINSCFYHGGMTASEKGENYKRWVNNKVEVMVATSAFGMGIDKADVRSVIHFNLPESIESYFQEAGRAGRDGNSAKAILLVNSGDEQLIKNQFLGALPYISEIKTIYKKLNNYFRIPYGELDEAAFDFNFSEFCKTYELNSQKVYNALHLLDNNGILKLSKEFKNHPKVQVTAGKEELLQFIANNKKEGLVLKALLRTYGGITDLPTKVNPILICDKTGLSERDVLTALERISSYELCSYKPSTTDANIRFLEPREDDKTINRISTIVIKLNDTKREKIERMLDYAFQKDLCSSQFLLEYFGEQESDACGNCHVCSSENNSTPKALIKKRVEVLKSLLKKEPMNSRTLLGHIDYSEEELIDLINRMLEKEIIKITKQNTYKINE